MLIQEIHYYICQNSLGVYDFMSVKEKSLMVEWLGWVSQGHEMYCHHLEVLGSNPCRVKLCMCSTSVKVILEPNIYDSGYELI